MRGNNKRCAPAVLLAVLVLLPFGATASVGQQDPASSPFAKKCAALTGLNLERLPEAASVVDSAQFVPATAQLPAHCAVRGWTAPQIDFVLKLPETRAWNDRFLFTGCGGPCGADQSGQTDRGLTAGFATASSDSGHRATGSSIMLWAKDNPDALVDWGHRSTHVASIATKEVTKRFYRRAAHHSYFVGSSTGGRQALIEAQRYPDDFDGIMANSPGHDLAGSLSVTWPWISRVAFDPAGRPILGAADLRRVAAEVMRQCDPVDGLTDAMISRPDRCRPDLTGLGLSKAKMRVLDAIYSAPRNSAGKILPRGLLPGSENTGDWSTLYAGDGDFLRLATEGLLRYAMYQPQAGPGFDIEDWSPEDWPRKFRYFRNIAEATTVDIDRFRAHGGKLMLTHPLGDGWINPATTSGYYERLIRRYGGRAETATFARLFLVPGAGHSAGFGNYGPARSALSDLVDWVERGVAPTRLNIKHPLDDQDPTPARIRPTFAYPYVARYDGTGSVNDPANFGPALPR